jgi:hypothetical protein
MWGMFDTILFSLSSCLFSKKKNTEIYKSIILPVVLHVWNLVSHTKGRPQIEGVWEQGAEENIWT